MRILVTGGSGYVGETVVRRLRERGDDVCVLDVIDNENRARDVEFIRGDIRDSEAVRRALRGVTVVHHNVAEVPLAKDRRKFESVNIGGTRVLCDAALRSGVEKVILMSSSAVYGVPSRNPIDQSVAPRPMEAYGKAKLGAERVAAQFIKRGLDVTIIRPRTILGHGRLGIFQLLFEWVRKGRPIYTLGDGSNRFQFIHVEDLADACLRADRQSGPRLFLVGTDRFGSIRSLLETLVQHANTHSAIRVLPYRPAQLAMFLTSKLKLSPLGDYHMLMYGREMYFDTTETQHLLGWRSKYSNIEMIVESYDWYLAHRAEVLARTNTSRHRSPIHVGILKLLELLP